MDPTHLDRPNDMPPMVVVHCPILLQHPCDHRSYCSSKTSLINWTVPIGSTCRPTSDHHCLMGSTRIYKLVPQLCTNFLFSPYPSILDQYLYGLGVEIGGAVPLYPCFHSHFSMEKSRSFPQYSSSYSGGEFRCIDEYSNSYSFNGPSDKGPSSSDPEIKRKKRVASYNFFTMEGKLKSSVRGSFKWIKTKVSEIRYGD